MCVLVAKLSSPDPEEGDRQADNAIVMNAETSEGASQAGAAMSPHASVKQVAGGMRPASDAPEREDADMMVAVGLGESSEGEEEEARPPKRRRRYQTVDGVEEEKQDALNCHLSLVCKMSHHGVRSTVWYETT